MDFLDFQIRGWLSDQNHVQVMVHSSPVGGMRKPVSIPVVTESLEKIRTTFRGSYAWKNIKIGKIAAVGHYLAQILLIPQVFSLLIRSLEHIGHGTGLRIRLCLDTSLIDLPWEYLYRPDADDEASLKGFLLLDPRISLVRESPNLSLRLKPSKKTQRLVFVAAFSPGGDDIYEVEEEHLLVSEAMTDLKDLVSIDYREASADHIDKALFTKAEIFHYAGHTNVLDGEGYLVREVVSDDNVQWLHSSSLAGFFIRAGIRLGVFNACNSGRWEFIEPLITAGLPSAIGIQGSISTRAAIAFSVKLYAALAIGLSLDESVTWARLHLLEPGVLPLDETFAWGTFMVYLPATDAVIFPRLQNREITNRQKVVQQQRNQTFITVNHNIGTMLGGQVIGVIGQI